MKNEERTVCNRCSENKMKKMKGKSLKPCPGSLFKAIERLMQTADIGWMCGIFIPWRLCHINLLLKEAMEKGL